MDQKIISARTEPESVMEMHRDLKQVLSSGLASVNLRLDAISNETAAMKATVTAIKETQIDQASLLDEVRLSQAACPARNSTSSVNARIGKLENFRDKVQEAGVLQRLRGDTTGAIDIRAQAPVPAMSESAVESWAKKLWPIITGMLIGAAMVGWLIATKGM